MRQRLFREGFCIVAYETGELVGIAGSDIHIGITGAALYLQQVLESDNYSHLTKIPICLGVQIEIWRAEELELAAASQESIDDTEFGAIPAAREAIETLERTKPDKSPSEGYEAEPCSICLEEMKVLDVEAARMPCKHVFHYDCIARWLNTSHLCPLCRFSMPTAHVSQFQTT
ncbi:hypothetical protein BT93_L1512 [Corymbia citriodora subsp. variegata]|uniref:RING-type E3 ubiquitin transferase n=1 Tax=Corymbia citriodora subsp. variegata TaxID=360336 RepID=A0A8T0CSE3_CORYI|nr:hypothetical protein BT93_L1512 [Corymbia citriodora subsp. variegata]